MFLPPELGEVEEACLKLRLPLDEGHAFFDYHSTRGWMLGKTGKVPMISWRHALNTWRRNYVKYGGKLVEEKRNLASPSWEVMMLRRIAPEGYTFLHAKIYKDFLKEDALAWDQVASKEQRESIKQKVKELEDSK